MERILGHETDMRAVEDRIIENFQEVFGYSSPAALLSALNANPVAAG